jgi:hypothetical protein
MVFGIVTLVMLVQSANAYVFISTTGRPLNALGIVTAPPGPVYPSIMYPVIGLGPCPHKNCAGVSVGADARPAAKRASGIDLSERLNVVLEAAKPRGPAPDASVAFVPMVSWFPDGGRLNRRAGKTANKLFPQGEQLGE